MNTEKKGFSVLLSALFFVTLLCSATGGLFRAVAAHAESGEETNAIESMQVNLSENIKVRFNAAVPDKATDVSMTFAFNGKEKTVTESTPTSDGRRSFVFDGVTPQHFNDEIKATLVYNDGTQKTFEKTTSVKEYCETLASTDEFGEESKTLAVDLLNYGAAAQVYLNEDVGHLANADLTEPQKALATSFESVRASLQNDTAFSDEGNGDILWQTANLRFDYNVSMIFKFALGEGITAENLTLKALKEGEEEETALPFEESDGVCLVRYTALSVVDFDKSVTVQAYDGETPIGSSLTYSVRSYVSAYADSATPMGKLAQATYVYGKSVEAYADSLAEIGFSQKFQNAATEACVVAADGTPHTVYLNGSNSKVTTTSNSAGTKYHAGCDGSVYGQLQDLSSYYITMDVTVPKTGKYVLWMRAQLPGKRNTSSATTSAGTTGLTLNVNGRNEECADLSALTYSAMNGKVVRSYDDTYSDWKNQINWSLTKMAETDLQEGLNTLTVKISGSLNIDYFAVQSADFENTDGQLLDFRSGSEIAVKNNYLRVGYGERIQAIESADTGGFTDMYLRIKDSNCDWLDVPVTTAMLEAAGLDYTTYGAQTLTIPLNGKNYTVTVHKEEPNDFVSEHFQAEACTYHIDADGNVAGKHWTAEETSKAVVSSDGTSASVATVNGAEGKAVSNLGDYTDGSNVHVSCFTVNVPREGVYDLVIRAQNTANKSLKNVFSVNVNGETDASGALAYTSLSSAGNVLIANQSGLGKGWNAMYYWTMVKLGTVYLEKGENVLRVKFDNNAPNIDYFMVQGVNAATPEGAQVINLRNAYNKNAAKETVMGANDAVTVQLGKTLGSLTADKDERIGYTGMWLRIPDYTYNRYNAYMADVPITDDMISGVNYSETGTYTATVTYSGYTATFTVVVA